MMNTGAVPFFLKFIIYHFIIQTSYQKTEDNLSSISFSYYKWKVYIENNRIPNKTNYQQELSNTPPVI